MRTNITFLGRGDWQVLAAQEATAIKLDPARAATLLKFSRAETVVSSDLQDALVAAMATASTRYGQGSRRGYTIRTLAEIHAAVRAEEDRMVRAMEQDVERLMDLLAPAYAPVP